MSKFFTQYKQWVEFQVGGQRIGRFMERVTGGQVTYAVAAGAPANSGGHVYRSTRFQIAEVDISGYLTQEQFSVLLGYFDNFHKDRNRADDFSIRRVYKDGDSNTITEVYERLHVMSPPQPEDADTSQDGSFMSFSIRVQPEKKTVYVNGEKKMVFDPDDALNDAYLNP